MNINGIQPVSPAVVDNKLIQVVMIIYNLLNPLIIPIVVVGSLIAFITIILGAACHIKTLKKVGATDLGIMFCALLFYFMEPTLIGLIKTIQQVFN